MARIKQAPLYRARLRKHPYKDVSRPVRTPRRYMIVTIVCDAVLVTELSTSHTWVDSWLELMMRMQEHGRFAELTSLWQAVVGRPVAKNCGNHKLWKQDCALLHKYLPSVDLNRDMIDLKHSDCSQKLCFNGPTYILTPNC